MKITRDNCSLDDLIELFSTTRWRDIDLSMTDGIQIINRRTSLKEVFVGSISISATCGVTQHPVSNFFHGISR